MERGDRRVRASRRASDAPSSGRLHEELRQMCEQIIAAQSREIEQIQAWFQDWYSVSYTPRMSGGGEKELVRLSTASGADFDIMFMEMMIRHHEGAISQAQTCLERASHRQLIRLCGNTIRPQSAEIGQMEE